MTISTVETSLAVILLAALATEVAARVDNPYEQPSLVFCSETLPNLALDSEIFLPWTQVGSTGPTFPTECAPEFIITR